MRNTVTIYGVGLVVALLAAYFSWTSDSDNEVESKDSVVVVNKKADQLESLEYREDELSVRLEPREDAHGEFVWASTERTKPAQPVKEPASKPHAHDHDAGTDSGAGPAESEPSAVPAEKPTVEEKAFKAGSKGEQVVESMAPFRAIRKLEGATEDRFASFGLDEPRGTLTLNYSGGDTRTFEVGGEGYGHRNIYIRDKKSGDIYLVDANSIRPLRYADARMAENMFYGHSRNEITGLAISDGTERIEAEQKNRDDSRNRTWVPKGESTRNVALESWIQKFERTRGTGFATESEAKQADKVLTVKLFAEKDKATTVDLLRGQTSEGDPAWYMRSEFTRGLVKIPTALGADLASDFPTVVSALRDDEGSDEAASPEGE